MSYLQKYETLINFARDRDVSSTEYYEEHHIVPSCWCIDELSYLKTDKNNLVPLTGKEHFKAHYYLAKIFGKEMWFAFWCLCNGNKNKRRKFDLEIEAELYEEAKINFSKLQKQKIVSNETKKKISKGMKGKTPKNHHTLSKIREKYWRIFTPENNVEVIKNLAEYCRNNNLKHSAMILVAKK